MAPRRTETRVRRSTTHGRCPAPLTLVAWVAYLHEHDAMTWHQGTKLIAISAQTLPQPQVAHRKPASNTELRPACGHRCRCKSAVEQADSKCAVRKWSHPDFGARTFVKHELVNSAYAQRRAHWVLVPCEVDDRRAAGRRRFPGRHYRALRAPCHQRDRPYAGGGTLARLRRSGTMSILVTWCR